MYQLIKYYSIFQLNDTQAATEKLFLDYEATMKRGGVDISQYDTICTGEIEADGKTPEAILEELYVKFNINRPADFPGHSLSVSDLVALEDTGTYFCDRIGWKKIN